MNLKKRVAVFRTNFLPPSETFIHNELIYHERYEVTVFARRWMNAELFPGHDVIALTSHLKKRRLESMVFDLSMQSWTFDRVFRQRRFNIVHAHFGFNGVHALRFAKRHGLPLVVTLHGHDVSVLEGHEKNQWSWRYYVKNYPEMRDYASAFFCDSESLRQSMIALGCPPDKLITHILGTDLNVFKFERRKKSNPLKVVMIGRFVEKKGFDDGIEAFAEICNKFNARLIIVGYGTLERYYKSLITKLGIDHCVEFTGPLPAAGINDLLNDSAVVLLPSRTASNNDKEATTNVVKEAYACGVPVIGTLHGGIPEMIKDGEDGFLVAERDKIAMANRLERLLSDETLRNRMGEAGYEKICREYEITAVNRKLETYYDQIIDNHEAGLK
ncbi:glycosyltransferase [bacterium]|nr:glycosyltransferase [bacterium]